MTAIIVVCFLFLFVAFPVASRIAGARGHYRDQWTSEQDENILFEDREADTYLISRFNQAKYISYARPRRGFVLVTSKRILAGQRPIFSKRFLIQYILYPGSDPSHASESIGGGAFRRGYQTYVFEPATVRREAEGKKPFVELTNVPDAGSSFAVEAIRIFTDKAAGFPVPHPSAGGASGPV